MCEQGRTTTVEPSKNAKKQTAGRDGVGVVSQFYLPLPFWTIQCCVNRNVGRVSSEQVFTKYENKTNLKLLVQSNSLGSVLDIRLYVWAYENMRQTL